MSKAKNEWIRNGLRDRGYTQKQLAVAWGSQQASVSRFLNGEELQDMQISKAVTLAKMLGITCEELAKGLGHNGVPVEPDIEGVEVLKQPLGSMNLSSPKVGVTRIEMRKDFSVQAAQQIIGIMASDQLPGG